MVMGMEISVCHSNLGDYRILMLLFLNNTNCRMDLYNYWALLGHVTIWIYGYVWWIRNSTPYFLWDFLHTYGDHIKRMCLEIIDN